jgi:hypothetical protein
MRPWAQRVNREVGIRGRSAYRVLAPMLVALLAAGALVVGPVVARALHSAPASCLGPGDPSTFSVGQGLGAGVVVLTGRPADGAPTAVSIRAVNLPAQLTNPQRVWIAGPGSAAVALGRRSVGCWIGAVPPAALTHAVVRASANPASPILAAFALPLHPQSGADLLARARRNSMGLASLREVTVGRPATSAPGHVVVSEYAGARVISRSSDGTQSFAWPGWRAGFEWVAPGIESSVVLGPSVRGGQQVVRVAGAVARTPLWMQLDIVPATGRVVWDSMNGPHHVMTSRFTDARP